MDKSAFQIHTFEEADRSRSDYSEYTIKERLEIAFYLTSVAYKFDMEHPPRMDKSLFNIKKREA